MKSPNASESVVKKFTRFSEHCTLHGFYYFSMKSSRTVHRLWALAIAGSFILCCFLSQMIWSRFVEDPTFTVVESLYYPTEKIPFPAIAVCDPEVYGPAATNVTNILSLRSYNAKQIQDFYRSFTEVQNTKYVPKPHVTKMHNILEDLGLSYDDLVHQLKKPCDVFIRECSWRSKLVDCSKMFREVFTIIGYCCQFDITYFRQSADNDTYLMAGVEITDALDMTVDTRTVRPNGSTAESFASLYVFDELNTLTLLDSSIIITPRTYFDVTVDVWVIDSSADVKALGVKSRECFLDSDGIHSSYYQCVTSLIMRIVVDSCRCVPFHFTLEEFDDAHPRCNWEKLLCVHQILAKVQGDIRSVVSENDCYQKCDYVQYETQAEYMKIERGNGTNSHLSRVSVHYGNNICIKYRREVLYTWDQMLANLGGIFGLCLGGSIISILEFVWFVLDLSTSIINIACSKANKQKISIVSEKTDRKKGGVIHPYPYRN